MCQQPHSRIKSLVLSYSAALAVVFCCATTWAVEEHRASSEDTSGILGEKVPGAERLEGRLLAPCCWNQTLDVHGSEIAYALRREIRTRLKAGESPDAIESSLIERYGSRLRAVPDRVPLEGAAVVGLSGLFVAAGGLVVLLVRWRRRRTASDLPSVDPAEAERLGKASDGLDARLDAELRRLD
ncbi:MAG: cytochrome c-type biogenesis protein CcmH [Polyangiaceae bacterium]